MTEWLPPWIQDWLVVIVPVGRVILILLAALALQSLLRRLIRRLGMRYDLPQELLLGVRKIATFIIFASALMLILERLGVSGTVLWTAFTGFAAVAAVAFFAAWSVLSNLFCTVLIFTARPFRLYDHVEILENGGTPGLKGRVIDINLVYTTLQEIEPETGQPGSTMQIPNNMFFQRALRRWRGGNVPQAWLRRPDDETPAPAPD